MMMINCSGRKYNTFQEALDNGEDEGRLEDFKVTYCYNADYGEDYIYLSSYEVYFELNQLLDLLYKAFPEEYASRVNQGDKTDE